MGLKIDGIAASSAIDTSSEAIDIENLDISSLKSGQGVLNYEHKNPKQPGASFLDILGAITYAKKIMSAEDCDSDRQRKYWEQIQLPFVYIQAELFDGEDHPGAVCAAAIIKFYHSRSIPILVRFSIDGHTIERDGNVLKHCIARDVALTIKPANHSCVSGVLDEKAKSDGKLDELSRSEDGMVRLPGVEFSMLAPEGDVDPMELIRSEVANLQGMAKAMTVGGMGAAPGDLRGGAALAKEDVQGRLSQRLTTAFRDWNRRSGKTLEEHLTKTLPDIHEEFLKKFVDLITEARLRKASELHEYLNKALAGEATKALAPKPQMAGPSTKVEGKGVPKPVMNEDEPDPNKMSTSDSAAADKDIENIRAQIHANNPGAATHGFKPAAEMPQVPPHVPGLRVGVHPDEAMDKDIEAIRASIRQTNPNIDQHGMVQVGTPEHARMQQIAATRGTTPETPEGLVVGQATKVLTPSVRKREGDDEGAADDSQPLTIRGQPVSPNPKQRIPTFNRDTGVLHTGRGSFPMYIPGRDSPEAADHFRSMMHDPHVNQFHDYAVRQWARLNHHLKNGTLPPAAVMHATLFSMLSPNTPVPMQELMYGHLVDHMKETGVDARDPAFATEENLAAWKARDGAQNLPAHSPEHWDRLNGSIRVKSKETDTGRKRGELNRFMLAGTKNGEHGNRLQQYHKIHDQLVNLVNKNRDNGRQAVRELMMDKTHGAGVPGLAPKTARYMMGMLGAGNVIVPDTHFVRHLYGLDRAKDSNTIKYLKDVMWRETEPGADTLDGIDDYYFRHHDAVQHMLEHPEHGKLFKDNPESAIFPAFWKHWVSIVPHERFRGLTVPKKAGLNEQTDHRPFWDAVAPFLKAEEQGGDPRWQLAARTAEQHHKWVHEHGETPAMMMYCAYLLPHLLGAGEHPLQKAEPDAYTVGEMPPKPPAPMVFRGQHVVPGEIRYRPDIGHELAGQSLKLVSSDPLHHVVIRGAGPSHQLVTVPRELEGKAYDVLRPAVSTAVPHVLHPDFLHSESRSPEQLALAQRIDFSHPRALIPGDNNTHAAFGHAPWTQGEPKVFIKPSSNYIDDAFVMRPDAALREAAFHNVARDVFGMGQTVPTTVAFWHPHDGRLHSAQDFVQGGRHAGVTNGVGESLNSWHASGHSPRMAVMDWVLGNPDRWHGNFMVAPDGSPRLIDHGFAFQYKGAHDIPAYVTHDVRRQPFSPDVRQWIHALDDQQLYKALVNSGIRGNDVAMARARLQGLKQKVAAGAELGYNDVSKG